MASKTTAEHYSELFARLESDYGELDARTLTGIIGFSAGGPISICRTRASGVYVTCELSLYDEQLESAEGLRFELMTREHLDQSTCQRLFTALGNLSMHEQLGDGHTIDMAQVIPGGVPAQLRLQLYSSTEMDGKKFGIYEVRAINDA